MSDPERGNTFKSIAFVVSEYKPGRCGVFDYSVRMAAGMQALGFEAVVLCVSGIAGRESLRSGEAEVAVSAFRPETAACHDILAVQYVTPGPRQRDCIRNAIPEAEHKRIHLMIHEIWRTPSLDFKLTTKESIVSLFQRFAVFRIIKALRPKTVSCSNGFYQEHLNKAGIRASLSPMPGNIPLGAGTTPPPGLDPPTFFDRRHNEFIWAAFGSIYCSYLNPDTFFARMRSARNEFDRPFKWVVAGNQKESDLVAFRAAAAAHGFGEDIHFTGALEPEAIDWILRNSDASFSATGRDFWQKSGGTLAAVERGLPVYFPRKAANPDACIEPELYTNLRLLLSSHAAVGNYSGPHSLMGSARHLVGLLVDANGHDG